MSWRWQFAAPEFRLKLGDHPEEMLARADVVKENPVRKVLRGSGFYFKCESRRFHFLVSEYRMLQYLSARGIPVTQAAACGQNGAESCLVTTELPNAVSVSDFLLAGPPSPEFRKGFAAFMRQVFSAGIFHADFHSGNILHSPQNDSFYLVDVCAVQKVRPWNFFRKKEMFRAVMDLRRDLDRKAMLELLRDSGCADPARYYSEFLKQEGKRLLAEWPRRRGQIRNGYPRFTIRTTEGLRTVHVSDAEYAAAEKQPGEFEEYAVGFFLDLAHIPHRRGLGFLPEEHVILYEPCRGNAVPDPVSADFRHRLLPCGIYTPPEAWKSDPAGRVCLYDLKSAAKQL